MDFFLFSRFGYKLGFCDTVLKNEHLTFLTVTDGYRERERDDGAVDDDGSAKEGEDDGIDDDAMRSSSSSAPCCRSDGRFTACGEGGAIDADAGAPIHLLFHA